AEAVLAVPFGVPVGEEEDSGPDAGVSCGKELSVDGVVFGPGGLDGAGEGENVFRIEAVVGGRSGGVPVAAVFDGVFGVFAKKCAGICIIGRAADVLKAPMEGLDAAVVVGGP